jgi:hypothetical protein
MRPSAHQLHAWPGRSIPCTRARHSSTHHRTLCAVHGLCTSDIAYESALRQYVDYGTPGMVEHVWVEAECPQGTAQVELYWGKLPACVCDFVFVLVTCQGYWNITLWNAEPWNTSLYLHRAQASTICCSLIGLFVYSYINAALREYLPVVTGDFNLVRKFKERYIILRQWQNTWRHHHIFIEINFTLSVKLGHVYLSSWRNLLARVILMLVSRPLWRHHGVAFPKALRVAIDRAVKGVVLQPWG